MRTIVCRGSVAELHALAMPTQAEPTAGDEPELWRMRPVAAAVAMGSAQKPEDFDELELSERSLALAPRRSGGGAVFIEPEHMVWIDLLAPRSSVWWSNELTENFMMVGRAWQQALRSLGVETALCAQAPDRTPTARVACWAGVGWGELVLGNHKVLGLSQRRTRWGVRVQAMAVIDDSSARIAEVVPAELRSMIREAIGASQAQTLAAYGLTAPIVEEAVLAAF